MARTRSSKNDAPRCSSAASTSCAAMRQRGRSPSPPAASRAASSRRKIASGATRVGRTRRAPSRFERRMRRQPPPHHFARQTQPVQPLGIVLARCAAAAPSIPTPPPKSRSPEAGENWNSPSTPCSCAPGVRCCQRHRKRMKSAAVTGSISRRKRPSVSRWMRARMRRWQNSRSRVGRKLPAQDLAFRFELRQRDLDVAQRQAQPLGQAPRL